MMRSIAVAVFTPFLLVVSWSGAVAGGTGTASSVRLPDRVLVKGGNSPYFISLASLTQTSGAVDWSAMPEAARTVLQSRIAEKQRHRVRGDGEHVLRTTDEPCAMRIMTPHDQDQNRSWAELNSSAAAVYRGKIVGVAAGLVPYSAQPVNLLAVEITKTLRPAAGYPTSGRIYVLSAAIDVTFAGERFCNAGQHDGLVPDVGDEILIFSSRGPIDDAGVVLPTVDERLVFSRKGEVRLPASLEGDRTLPDTISLDILARDVVRRVPEAVR
jgi:hypothetical protein